ncbi:class I SAM-dependent DNA methyltransferase [Arcobacter vandammei]|uniref:class I SAM-dependent DNA methyltransferase n=1 Tax=Arcobacter vandammei TaxID=2782243 RepID=UPI0018DF995A|nr:class I SAM-dependent methyltransferase [Arcobacter vandammei]
MTNLDLYAKIEPYLDLEEATYTLHKEFMKIVMENSLENILDIGCGRGYFLENLRINGLNYLGIDQSKIQIDVCKEKGLNAKNIELKDIKEKFDCAVAIFDVVNFVNKDELKEFFSDIKNVLNPNGYFIFDVNTLYAFENIAQGSINIDLEDGFIAVNSDFENSRLITNFFLFEKEKDDKYIKNSGQIVQEYYKNSYLGKLLKECGFSIFEKKELFLYTDEEADKIIFICKKASFEKS